MTIVLSCQCGRKLQVREEFAGQEGLCPSCGRTMLIPASEEPALRSASAESVRPESPLQLEPAPPRVERSSWPEAEPLPNHGGGVLARDSDFFVDPPEDIGAILSAHTTLMAGKQPWKAGGRLVVAGIAGLFGLAVGSVVVLLVRPRAEFWHFLWPTVGSLLGVVLARALTRFFHTCTYVGRDGVARFACSGTRERISRSEVFLFREAVELRTGQTVRYNHGTYQGTDYTFTWTDAAGRKCYVIAGTHRSSKGMPPTTDPYHYGRAAESAWTAYLHAQAQRQIELAGCVIFNLPRGRSLRLGRRSLTIQLNGEPVEWTANEIDAIAVEKATVKIKRTDAKEGWFSATGVVRFPLEGLGNAALFFELANRLLGVRIEAS